ncbi:histidine phosphatase superfamily [Podospora australis]|uniref:Histidine phosphatase superfamily n=1 Tax=Podospora australis TaxID=1536484 RepID=A0AAN6WZ63_9PEZI|nr:histidine phosphatase superfamily [Podospora australis]
MASLAAVVVALLVSGSVAQNEQIERVWSSVAWVLYGDRTPIALSTSPVLTPLGAYQLMSQGSLLRDRYLAESLGTAEGDEDAPIVGIDRNVINNAQISIVSTTDSYTIASAQALFQGLYPPVTQGFTNATGGQEAARLANGTLMNYPLDGYQYPAIKTVSRALDPDSIWIAGDAHCSKHITSLLNYSSDVWVSQNYQNNMGFYQNLWPRIFDGIFSKDKANFYNAYNLYDYASYRWNHDAPTRSLITADELDRLRQLASTDQRNRHANLSVSGAEGGDMIRAISGRTLAGKVLALFFQNVRTQGNQKKLNFAFSSFEPFVSFFALSRLTSGASKQLFTPLPHPGATMLFELFSRSDVDDNAYPMIDDLYVRFLYRNSTDPAAKLRVYSLFNTGPNFPEIKFSEFIRYMEGISIDTISEWCNTCDAAVSFCAVSGSLGNNGNGNDPNNKNYWRNSPLSPAAAGAVGAAVTAAVAGLVVLAAMLFGGMRFRRHEKGSARNSSLGGFKGAEKMGDDADVEFAKSGVRHERAGSWELRDGKTTKTGTGVGPADVGTPRPISQESGITGVGAKVDEAGSGQGGAGAVRVEARDLTHPERKRWDDDAISEYGAPPVKPAEF